MSSYVIVVDKRKDFRWEDPGGHVVTADDYIASHIDQGSRALRVINLCRDYGYLATGYYVSLLAEARGSRVLPNVKTILDLGRRELLTDRIRELDEPIGDLSSLPRSVNAVSINVYFGRTDDPAFARVAARAFELFECPLLRIDLERGESWRVIAVEPLGPRDVPKTDDAAFIAALEARMRRRWANPRAVTGSRIDLAVLWDPNDPMPPSKRKTIQKLAEVGEQMGVHVEPIQKKDYGQLRQFDALFIRETTAIQHHTFRFARKAEREGMPVIDDPTSILRCANKVFLTELLRSQNIAMPRTWLVTRKTIAGIEVGLDYPVVLKIPDGSFSRGVKRAATVDEFRAIAEAMLKSSDIILVQEFVKTEFDWRVGVLDGEPLFVAQYHMCGNHWQILKHAADGTCTEGATVAVPLAEAPRAVVDTAVAAARLVGRGFYGVDLKETGEGVVVMEINDNPNLDVGMEDTALGDALYRRLLQWFTQRVAERRGTTAPALPALLPAPDRRTYLRAL